MTTYLLAWPCMMVLAIINGSVREFAFQPYMSELTAHQISTVTLLLVFAVYFRFLFTRWPLATAKQSWTVGIVWFLFTLAFEFGIGLTQGASWAQMFHAYNLMRGQFWLFIPLWVLTGPYVFYRMGFQKL